LQFILGLTHEGVDYSSRDEKGNTVPVQFTASITLTITMHDGSGQDNEERSDKNTKDSEKKDTTPLRLPFP
jgi:hypothetical protein